MYMCVDIICRYYYTATQGAVDCRHVPMERIVGVLPADHYNRTAGPIVLSGLLVSTHPTQGIMELACVWLAPIDEASVKRSSW